VTHGIQEHLHATDKTHRQLFKPRHVCVCTHGIQHDTHPHRLHGMRGDRCVWTQMAHVVWCHILYAACATRFCHASYGMLASLCDMSHLVCRVYHFDAYMCMRHCWLYGTDAMYIHTTLMRHILYAASTSSCLPCLVWRLGVIL